MALSVAPLYAALLGFLLVYLSIRVIRLRRRLKVVIGAVWWNSCHMRQRLLQIAAPV